jgi:hypothetical protein
VSSSTAAGLPSPLQNRTHPALPRPSPLKDEVRLAPRIFPRLRYRSTPLRLWKSRLWKREDHQRNQSSRANSSQRVSPGGSACQPCIWPVRHYVPACREQFRPCSDPDGLLGLREHQQLLRSEGKGQCEYAGGKPPLPRPCRPSWRIQRQLFLDQWRGECDTELESVLIRRSRTRAESQLIHELSERANEPGAPSLLRSASLIALPRASGWIIRNPRR